MVNAKETAGATPQNTNRPQVTRMRFAVILVLFLVSLASRVEAEQRRVSFGPPSSEVDIRAYRLGILPLNGRFDRFNGSLSYDPDNHGFCQVHLTIEADSLTIEEPSMRSVVTGPAFLDVMRYPSLTYTGNCDRDRVNGALGMHGVTGPFPLSLTWSADGVQAEGRLARADWGMTALPLLAGRTILIKVMIPLKMNSTARN
jgi:polyisoprenoid-binding protein YceI